MTLRFESSLGNMIWPYNPKQISFASTKLIVEHEYPHRSGAETEDMGRKSMRVDVSGVFLQEPAVPSISPQVLMNILWSLHEIGAVGKVYGSELGNAVEGRSFRIVDLKGNRDEGTVGDIPYSFTFIEHYQPQPSKNAANNQVASAAPHASAVASASTNTGTQTKDIIYIVQKGDTLWDLAANYYKDPLKYKKIMVDNKVGVPDMKPGLKLTLKGVKVRG
ncbi:DNA circularization N-terminal domain-containing protein [Paenibacillus chitinolyticus]